MLRHMSVRRSPAVTAVIAVSILSTGALPATADQGGNGRGAEHSTVKNDKDDKNDRAPGKHKGHQEDTAKASGPEKAQGKPHKAPKPAKPAPRQAPAKGQGKTDKGDKPGREGRRRGDKGGKGGGKDRVPGNNGTVKITPLGETDGTPNNHPHVGCSFQIEWYGYDKGDDIVSRSGSPCMPRPATSGLAVSGPSSVFVGGDAASGAGTDTGLDGVRPTRSPSTGRSPEAGLPREATVATPYSQGNDTKTKVFWVQGCDDTEVPPTEEPPTEQPPTEEPPTEQPPAEEPPVIVTPPEPVNPPDSTGQPDDTRSRRTARDSRR